MANKAIKIRLYPDDNQRTLLAKTFGCVRYVFNHFLAEDRSVGFQSYYTHAKSLTVLKQAKPFLKEVDSSALQQTLKCLEQSEKTGKPHFKTRRSRQSYTTLCTNHNIRFHDIRHIQLPKLGVVKCRFRRDIPDNWIIKRATVSRTASGKYYASILFEYENQVSEQPICNIVGLDFSMRELFVSDTGFKPCYPRFFRRSQTKLSKEQRRLSKMQRYSCNYFKQKRRIAVLHERIANQRLDFLHKTANTLIQAYDAVAIEDLSMNGMAKLYGKSVADNGWYLFTEILAYKLADRGKRLVKINKWFPSSQLCHCCGYQNSAVKDFSIRVWICPACNAKHDRDINAAVNIKNEGLRLI